MFTETYLVTALQPERQDSINGIFKTQKLVVSDSVGVKGYVTGNGIPQWAEDHAVAHDDAKIVSDLMASGCKLIGKAQVDEFGVSISGSNKFMSDLRSPHFRRCRVGGSSSGIAIALASGKASIGVGNDCCGGVRIPASYCNLFAYRPSPGLIDMLGIRTLATSFDSVGVMAKSLPVLQQLYEKYTENKSSMVKMAEIKYAKNLFAMFLSEQNLERAEAKFKSNNIPLVEMSSLSKILLTQSEQIHSVLLGREIGLEYGEWFSQHKPEFGPETSTYLNAIGEYSFKDQLEAKKKRVLFTETVHGLFDETDLLMIPSSPGPVIARKSADSDEFVKMQRRLSAIAEIAGLPQLTIPMLKLNDAPMGVSLLAKPGQDKLLFEAAMRWFL